jgi:hypothetical protein
MECQEVNSGADDVKLYPRVNESRAKLVQSLTPLRLV